MIPKQLQHPDFRFVLVKKKTKQPIGAAWVKKGLMFNDKKLLQHVAVNKNYGVLTGQGDLIVIDCDNEKLSKVVNKKLPSTFTVLTGGDGSHYYFLCKGIKKKIILTNDNEHLGEVQAYGQQVIGAGSVHPSGKLYKVLNKEKIAEISFDDLIEALKPFMKELNEAELERLKPQNIKDIPITSVVDTSGFKSRGNELYGTNNWHGSETGMNTWINPSKNIGYCFRCAAAITVAKAIALNEGIIKTCSDYLTNEQFFQVLDVAKLKYGLQNVQHVEQITEEKRIYSHKELLSAEIKKPQWVMDDFLQKKTMTMFAGATSHGKTIVGLDLGLSIASGEPFLNKFTPNGKFKVLWIDFENGAAEIKDKVSRICQARNIPNNIDIDYVFFPSVDIGTDEGYEYLDKLFSDYNPDVAFIDTLRGSTNIDECKSEEIRRIYNQYLTPLLVKHDLAMVMLHHTRKLQGKDSFNRINEIRGSGDITAITVNVFSLRINKARNRITMYHDKARSSKPLEDQAIHLDWANGLMMECTGVAEEAATKVMECKEKVLEFLGEKYPESVQRKEIEIFLGDKYARGTVGAALKELFDEKKLTKPKTGWYELTKQGNLEEYE